MYCFFGDGGCGGGGRPGSRSSRLIPACRNSGSVVRRRWRRTGPICLCSMSQRRLPGPHKPPALRMSGSSSCGQRTATIPPSMPNSTGPMRAGMFATGAGCPGYRRHASRSRRQRPQKPRNTARGRHAARRRTRRRSSAAGICYSPRHAALSRARRPLPFRAASASRNVSALSCAACAWRRA